MSKIVFINPSQDSPDTGTLSKEASLLPPLGLCYLASAVKAVGYEPQIIDCLALKISNEEAVSRALNDGARYVGVTATTDTIYLAAEVAAIVKKRSPDIKVLIGGPHFTAVPEKTLKDFPAFDIGVIGEGEQTLVELISALDTGKDLAGVKGIAYRVGSSVAMTERREFIKDLDNLPLPAWELLPDMVRTYKPAVVNYKRLPSTSLVTSRGCPGSCAFCDTKVFGSKYRVHSAEYVLRTIRYLKEHYGIKDICFYDDVFTVFKERLVDICKGLTDEKSKVDWSCQARVNNVDYEMMKMMKDAGCWKISFGVESGSDDILKLMNKHATVERARRAVADANRAGLEVEGYFILGFFGENKDTLKATKDFIMNSDIDMALLSYFLPFPGSPAYAHAKEYGSFDENWRNMNALESDAPQFIPNGLTSEELVNAQKDIYRDFYFRPKIFAKYVFKMIKNPAYAMKLATASVNFAKFLFKGRTTPRGN